MRTTCPGLDVLSMIAIAIAIVAFITSVISALVIAKRGENQMAIFVLSIGIVVLGMAVIMKILL
ncbi:MAG: hypothetical protein GXO55_10325 [Chloroflexi bacterium]|nr:hypothetical protein [Chloroflexota bacterium]